MSRARIGLIAAAVLLAGACTGGGSSSSGRTTTTPPPTSSTTSTTVLVTVPGNPRTTSTLPTAVGPGTAGLAGSVDGPEGPVPGANVRVERLVRDSVAVVNVPTDATGHWTVPAVNGGRYRVRAWRPPDLAQLQAVVLFVPATKTVNVPLLVAQFGTGNTVASMVPNPPVVGQPSTLVITLSDGSVDSEGVVHTSSRTGSSVQLLVLAGLTVDPPDIVAADAAGKATFAVHCTQPGPPAAVAVVDTVRHPLDIPACVGPR